MKSIKTKYEKYWINKIKYFWWENKESKNKKFKNNKNMNINKTIPYRNNIQNKTTNWIINPNKTKYINANMWYLETVQ